METTKGRGLAYYARGYAYLSKGDNDRAIADLSEAIHGHPNDQFVETGITFTPLVPRPGRYKLWVQFQRGRRVSTASFVIDVR